MKIWLTTTARNESKFEESRKYHEYTYNTLLEPARESILKLEGKRYSLASSPEQADIIVYVEPEYLKFRNYLYILRDEDLIQKYPNKCFVIDCADTSWGFLPGVYTSLLTSQVNPQRFRSGGYLREYNPWCKKLYEEQKYIQPKLLFSFRGAANLPIRQKIFDANFSSNDISITLIETTKFFDYNAEKQKLYTEEVLNSKFVLCPRGWSPSSIRLYEVMQLGRVPVILSDQWVPPEGPAWSDFSLRISESKVNDLAEIIRAYEPYASEMGQLAREAWENFFSPEIIVFRMLNYIESIILERDAEHDESIYQKQWLTWGFDWERGWTPVQSFVRAVKEGTLVEKLKSKLS